ncbi:MAG: tRNA lysidine(34) synthetase TilS, partial [Longimicrobiales bacterium]|nr:tRNA lysidine(34) synthetase TilS [Longimicrobiales bacterium]
MSPEPELARRFRAELEDLEAPRPGDGAVVALSGGLDSLVLLHLLRFASTLPASELVAAHLDHGMRPESADDADWLRGLLEAWRVEGRFARLERGADDEAEARTARYDFLERVGEDVGASWILTGHHADDQAETVLFRIVRGTGLRGLRGIPRKRDPGILRPLLGFWKSELRAYAETVGIRPRFDESNLDRRFARNVLRHDVLPTLEADVAPGARRALVRLARLAREEEAAWESVEERVWEEVVVGDGSRVPGRDSGLPDRGSTGEDEGPRVRGEDPDRLLVLDRSAFLSHHPGIRARILRRALRSVGVQLDEAGTREALAFTSEGASGARWMLPDGWVLTREFDRLVIEPSGREPGADEPLDIRCAAPGHGELQVGGRRFRAWWAPAREVPGTAFPSAGAAVTKSGGIESPETWTEEFSRSALLFPLRLRGWNPGDRIRLPVGSKKLKKLFGERRVPVRDRHRRPVVSDARGRVLWLPGLARSTLAVPEKGKDVFTV